MPLGLLSLAANLQIGINKVTVYKPIVRLINKSDYKQAATDILKYKPGLIGFSTWCITYPASLLIAKEIKSQAPEIPIVFGGPHASVLSRETLENFPFIDFVLMGEADISFPQFIKELTQPIPNLSCIPGLCFRSDSGHIQNNRLNGAIANPDDLPIPAYELVPKLKWMKLDVGRGCPFQCTFCSTSDFFSKKYRVKSADRIISEMMQAFQNKGIKSFSFAHDMFTLNKKFVFKLCDKLIAVKKTKEIEFKWTCSARIDCVSEEMIIKMKAAGCSDIFFGIETGSQRMQQIIKKNLDISKAYKTADICRLNGINMHASFIIGFPEETKKEINKTLKCALILALKGALTQISELTLLPGTPIYGSHFNKLKFDGQFSNFSRNFCGEEEINLIKMYPEIFSSFYYLPVKPIGRDEMLFLRYIINQSKHFRNTLFLLSELIEKDIKDADLLSLFKIEHKRITTEKKDQDPVVLHWIKVLDDYIIRNSAKIKTAYLKDIFAYEGYSALLTTIYSSWQLIQPKTNNHKFQYNFKIKPAPIWKILTINYNLENTLPSENKWEVITKRLRKGKYNYLLFAITGDKCRRIRINETELFLYKNLSELSFSDYVEKVKLVIDTENALLWLKKLRRWGILEFT